MVHTLAYAGFLEDPSTWLLLAVGGALAISPATETARAPADPKGERSVPATARATA